MTKLLVSRATIRRSRYPTSEHWYVLCHPWLFVYLGVPITPLQVEQIMLAPNSSYSISSLAALREVNALTSPMSKTQAESVLASFVAKGWLLKSKCVAFPLYCNHRKWVHLSEPTPTSQKGSLFVIPTRPTRTTTLSQVHLSRRDPRLHHLLRGMRQFQRENLNAPLTYTPCSDPHPRPRMSQGKVQSTNAQPLLRDVPPVEQ
jgi:hypothetical protein